MTNDELKERMKAYVQGWKETGELLETERYERVRNTNTAAAIARLSGMVDLAVKADFHPEQSGLVEFHKILARSRK